MDKNRKAQITLLLKEHLSIDLLRETFPDEDAEEIVDYVMSKGLLKKRPKMQYMAGIKTYIVSDEDILDKVQEALLEGKTKHFICTQYHIGNTRLTKMIAKYNLTVSNAIKEKELTQKIEKQQQEKKLENQVKKEEITNTEQVPVEEKLIEKEEKQLEEPLQENSKTSKLADEELKVKILQGIKEGKPKKHIARDLQIGIKKLNRLLNETDANVPVKKNTITAKLIAQVQNYLKYDTKNEKIASNLGISVNKVKEIKRLLKLTVVPEDKRTTDDEPATIEEKIVYANMQYGIGRWKFLTKDECIRLFRESKMEFGGDIDDFYDY